MFYSVHIEKLQKLIDYLYDLKDFVFRGQNNSEWELCPKLDRMIKNSNKSYIEKWYIEEQILEKFQKNASLYLEKLPDYNDYYSWFSIIQHYGGPTRLLDFSYSPFIAMFFSVYDYSVSNDFSLWAINKELLLKKIAQRNNFNYLDLGFKDFKYKTTEIFNETVFDRNIPKVNSMLLLEQRINHQRIAIQQGLFLSNLDNMQEFYECLKNMLNKGKSYEEIEFDDIAKMNVNDIGLIKFNIDNKLKAEIISKLYKMNITAEVLFPGLEGFVRRLNFTIFE